MPLSATLTEDEAATIIQSHYRGYLVRRQPKAQLFRTWQRKVQEERKAAEKIKTFMKKVSSTLAPNMSCDRRKSRQGPLLQEEGERGARENQGIPEESNMQDNSLLTTGEHI